VTVPSRKVQRRRHIPHRTCVGCRQVLPKRSLIRIVHSSEGVKIDPTGKAHGRGAYLHDKRSCWHVALGGSLSRALRAEITSEIHKTLIAFMENLTDE
jgi:predicted RNA-binding protein YlxR (DUF448 family)